MSRHRSQFRFHLVTAVQIIAFMIMGTTLALGLLWAIFTFIASQVAHA